MCVWAAQKSSFQSLDNYLDSVELEHLGSRVMLVTPSGALQEGVLRSASVRHKTSPPLESGLCAPSSTSPTPIDQGGVLQRCGLKALKCSSAVSAPPLSIYYDTSL